MRKSVRRKKRVLLVASAAALAATGIWVGLVAAAWKKAPDSALPPVLALDNTGRHAPYYMGATATSYTGNLGGIIGANAKCAAAYAGSHMCNTREILKSGATSLSPASSYGWVSCDLYFVSTAVGYTSCDAIPGSTWSTGSTDYTCSQWTTAASAYGTAVYGGTGQIAAFVCGSSLPIECCKG